MTPRRPLEIYTSAPKGPTKLASAGKTVTVAAAKTELFPPDPRITALQAENEKLRDLLGEALGNIKACYCGGIRCENKLALRARIQAALEPKP